MCRRFGFNVFVSIEFVRNGVEISHNLFDLEPREDGGNLICGFGEAAAPRPASFHDNLILNPGCGVIGINEVVNNFEIRINHIIARTTAASRTEGFFAFDSHCDVGTITIGDNIIERQGQTRPPLRCKESYGSVTENNLLTNVSDADRYANAKADRGPCREKPLQLECWAPGEFTVDGWQAKLSRK